MYPSAILTLANSYVHENVRTKAFSANDKMQYFNDAVRDLVSEARAINPLFGLQTTSLTQTVSVNYTDIPAWTDRVLRVLDDTDRTDEKLPADLMDFWQQGYALSDTRFWWVEDDRTNTWTLWRTTIPWKCHYGTAQALGTDTTLTLAVDGAATTVGSVYLGNYYNDYLNGAYLYARTCTTAAKQGQRTLVTDHAGATGIVTVAAWPAGKPDGTVV